MLKDRTASTVAEERIAVNNVHTSAQDSEKTVTDLSYKLP